MDDRGIIPLSRSRTMGESMTEVSNGANKGQGIQKLKLQSKLNQPKQNPNWHPIYAYAQQWDM